MFIPVITYALLPFSAEAKFTYYFGIPSWKKRPSSKLDRYPQLRAKKKPVYIKLVIFHQDFVFNQISREKICKMIPSYFFDRPTVLYVITWKNKNHTYGKRQLPQRAVIIISGNLGDYDDNYFNCHFFH